MARGGQGTCRGLDVLMYGTAGMVYMGRVCRGCMGRAKRDVGGVWGGVYGEEMYGEECVGRVCRELYGKSVQKGM